MAEAQARLQKKYNTSVYSAEFGSIKSQFKETSDVAVLKYKKVSELPLAVILTDKAKSYLDTWLGLDDLEVYKSSVLQCMRSLFALIRTQAVSKSSYSAQFQYNKALVTPVERIDKRLFAKTNVATVPASQTKKKPEAAAEILAPGSKMAATTAAGPPSKPSAIRGEILRGNGYITASCFVPDKVSSYQSSYK